MTLYGCHSSMPSQKAYLTLEHKLLLIWCPPRTIWNSWRKATSEKCIMCGSNGSLCHTLYLYPIPLQQGRFKHDKSCSTWPSIGRANTQLNFVPFHFYANAYDDTNNGSTVPHLILSSNNRNLTFTTTRKITVAIIAMMTLWLKLVILLNLL